MKSLKSLNPTLFAILGLLFLPYWLSGQTTVPAGNVSGTWSATGSPYLINGNIKVPTGQKLVITEGVRVEFQGKYKMDVWGVLQVLGKANDTVLFTPKTTSTGWLGVMVHKQPTTNDSTILDYARFEYRGGTSTTIQPPQGSAFFIDTCDKLRISNCRFNNNLVYVWGACGMRKCKATIYTCTFEDNLSFESNPQALGEGTPYASALGAAYSSINVNNCLFTHNHNASPNMTTGMLFSSVVEIAGTTSTLISNCNFLENGDAVLTYASADIQADGNTTVSEVHNCLFRRKQLDTTGNTNKFSLPVFLTGNVKSLKLTNCKFVYHGEIANIANDNLTGISTLILQNCEFYKMQGITNNGSGNTKSKLYMNNCYVHNCIGISGYPVISGGLNSDMYFSHTIYVNNSDKIENDNGAMYFYNCIVANNQRGMANIPGVDTLGNGIHFSDFCNGYIYNSIITGNKSATGQIKNIDFAWEQSKPNLYLYNSILEGGKSSFTFWDTSMLKHYSGMIESTAQFVNPTAGAGRSYEASTADWHPLNTCSLLSKTFNAGISPITNYIFPTLDLDSNPRFANGLVDIGPYEIQKPKIPRVVTEPKDTNICQFYVCKNFFANAAYSDSLQYRWQESPNGSSWTNIAGQTGNTLNGYKPSKAGITYIRAIVTNPLCGSSDTTRSAKLTVNASPVPNLGADKNLLQSDSLTLNPGTFPTYSWSTGATTSTLKVNKTNLSVGNNYLWVKVTASNGCSNSDTIKLYLVPGLGTNSLESANIKVYPVPMKDELTIELPLEMQPNTIVKYHLNDISGKEILHGTCAGTMRINTAELVNGTYMLMLEYQGKMYDAKLVK